jgi:hypothetical protein
MKAVKRRRLRLLGRNQVADLEAVVLGEAGRDQRAVAGPGVTLDAEQCRSALADEPDDRVEVGGVENLLGVALGVLGRKHRARAFALTESGVLPVLGFPQLGGRRQLGQVLVTDPRLSQSGLQPSGVGPGVLAATNPSALADVEDQVDPGVPQGREKRITIEAVDPDRRDLRQLSPSSSILIPAARYCSISILRIAGSWT